MADADRPVEDADSEHDQPLPLHRLALAEEMQLGPRRGKRMSGTIVYIKKHLTA